MKVLQINSVCGIRSTGRICTDLADILMQEGNECKIGYGRESVPEKYNDISVRIGTEYDVKLHALRARIFDDSGFGSKKSTNKFLKLIDEFNPDVIHLHNIHGYYINIDVLFGYLKPINKPVIWTLHDCWSFTGHCTHFDSIGCNKWLDGCFKCPQKENYPSSFLFDRSKKNYQDKLNLFTSIDNMTIVTPSKWLSSIVNKSFLKGYPTIVIPNGIDLSIFKPTPSNQKNKLGLEGKKIILGVASSWGERKGLSDFIELSKMLDDTYKIVLVGVTEKEARYLPNNIIGIKRTNNIKELAELYTLADVFVNPSKLETMGLTTVESLACGTPVIVYNKTGLPETVDDTCGFVVETNPEAIFSALKKCDFTSEACIARAHEYEKKKQYDKYIKLYCEKILEIKQ